MRNLMRQAAVMTSAVAVLRVCAMCIDGGEEASGTLVRMAGTIRSWRLDLSVRNQLVGQIAYADALGQDNRLGAKALFDAWR